MTWQNCKHQMRYRHCSSLELAWTCYANMVLLHQAVGLALEYHWIRNLSWIFTLLSEILVTCAKNLIVTCLIVNIADKAKHLHLFFTKQRSCQLAPAAIGNDIIFIPRTVCCFAVMPYFLFPPLRGNGIQQLPCHLQTVQGLVMLSFTWVPGTLSILSHSQSAGSPAAADNFCPLLAWAE